MLLSTDAGEEVEIVDVGRDEILATSCGEAVLKPYSDLDEDICDGLGDEALGISDIEPESSVGVV